MTKEQILKHLDNQIDYFVYELKRSIINTAVQGHQDETIWDKFKGFMHNLQYGKNNPDNPSFTKKALGHGLGAKTYENRTIPLTSYKFFKEWYDNLNIQIKPLNEDYSVPELPAHLKNTQLNRIIDRWAEKFRRALMNTIGLLGVSGVEIKPATTEPTKEKPATTEPDAKKPPADVSPADATSPADKPIPADVSPADATSTTDVSPADATSPTDVSPVDTTSPADASSPTTEDPSTFVQAKTKEEALENVRKIKPSEYNQKGGGVMPKPYTNSIEIKNDSGESLHTSKALPYILRFGDPRIDLLYYFRPVLFEEFMKYGRIETKKDFYPSEINDEIKKSILRNKFLNYNLKKIEGKTLTPEQENLKNDTRNIVFNKDSTLSEIIAKIQEFTSTTTAIPKEREAKEKNKINEQNLQEKINYILERIETLFSLKTQDEFDKKTDKGSDKNYIRDIKDILTNENFSKEFLNQVKTKLESNKKIHFLTANIENITGYDDILKNIDFDDFLLKLKTFSKLIAIENFVNNFDFYSEITKSESKVGTISEFIASLSEKEKEYLKTRFASELKKKMKDKLLDFPSTKENISSFEELENTMTKYLTDNNTLELVNLMINLMHHCVNARDTRRSLVNVEDMKDLD